MIAVPGFCTCGWKMALSVFLFLELLVYGAAFICGIVTAALVTVTQGEFGSRCILYGAAKWNTTSKSLGLVQFGSGSLCGFISAVSVVIAVYCFCTVFYFIYANCIEGASRGLRWLTACLVMSCIYLFFLLVSGCLLRVGLNSFCQSILAEHEIKSCSDAEKRNWTAPYNGSRFYQNFTSAETSTWVNFFFWIVVLALLIVQRKQGDDFKPLNGANSDGTASSGETDRLVPSGPRP
ncbi:transmembrane protein 179B-like [Heterodontus francisci]|uniref:transmembrane protein 179B-like n=1 Tax=Heterodontus francisci TaxID=7792 RepID=UPI00355B100E